MHAPTEFAGFGVLSVVSVPVTGGLDATETTSVLALATLSTPRPTRSSPPPRRGPTSPSSKTTRTREKAWDARHLDPSIRPGRPGAPTPPRVVPGDLRNQFSLSEHEGHFRVVTTSGDTWGSSSRSSGFCATDGELVEVGSVGDMGNGEAVQSVRFVGDVGYVVTFRQIDPFYTLDLRDPAEPARRRRTQDSRLLQLPPPDR